MSSPKYFQDVGANYIGCGGGYFRGWYNWCGQIYYLAEVHDTRGCAEQAARRSLKRVQSSSSNP